MLPGACSIQSGAQCRDDRLDGKHRLSRIVYCTDYSINSGRALQYAISPAAQYYAELTMLHVVEGTPDPTRAKAIMAARAEQLDKLIADEQSKHLNVRPQ